MRKLIPLARLAGAPARAFSGAAPLVLPTRVFDRHDLLIDDFQDAQQMAIFTRDEQTVLDFFSAFGHRMPAELLGDLTESLVAHQVDLSQTFNLRVAPVFAAYLSKMTRDHSVHFGRVLRDFLLMEADSPLVWDALWSTYRAQKMHRYIPIYILIDVVVNACLVRAPPLELFQTALPVLAKHRHRLTEKQIDELLDGLQRVRAEPPLQPLNLIGLFEDTEAPPKPN